MKNKKCKVEPTKPCVARETSSSDVFVCIRCDAKFWRDEDKQFPELTKMIPIMEGSLAKPLLKYGSDIATPILFAQWLSSNCYAECAGQDSRGLELEDVLWMKYYPSRERYAARYTLPYLYERFLEDKDTWLAERMALKNEVK